MNLWTLTRSRRIVGCDHGPDIAGIGVEQFTADCNLARDVEFLLKFLLPLQTQQFRANIRNGSKPAASGPNLGVRFTPESCRDNCRPARQLRA
ncbi:MAG: hypothetical protein WBF47_01225, partial [Xanthobacteraceae bacterium]